MPAVGKLRLVARDPQFANDLLEPLVLIREHPHLGDEGQLLGLGLLYQTCCLDQLLS